MPDDFTRTVEAAAAYERLHGPLPPDDRPTLAELADGPGACLVCGWVPPPDYDEGECADCGYAGGPR